MSGSTDKKKHTEPIGADTEAKAVRLCHFLAQSGAASRRHADGLIASGRVSVNGETVTSPGFKVQSDDTICLDGQRLEIGRRYYIMLNKPRGYVCTNDDCHAEQKAVDLIKIHGVRLFSVGRLDKDSEGLILFTNDGDFAAKLGHPRHGVKKTYAVNIDKPLSPGDIKSMLNGIHDEGEILRALSVHIETKRFCIIVMGEGKKREIRRMLKRLGKKTLRLQRIAVGKLFLGKLAPGQWRFLSAKEIELSMKN
ncbi:MAG: hypothetical protein A2X49_13450 [Lentisphaerae bacterium GWF2_52_8]|nr:MAG: hypothetical protein A2X49_13450 [Lentisphaerae bacterium GWF2_52_8]